MNEKNHERFLSYEDNWPTQLGIWFSKEGKIIYRGKDLLKELKDTPWMKLLIYGITGKMYDSNAIKLLEAMWVITSYPEPRLWPNRVASIAGTVRSTAALGVGAALTVGEATKLGYRVGVRCIEFLYRAMEQLDHGIGLEEIVLTELKKHRAIPGFGRPAEPQKDERIEPLLEIAESLGFKNGKYVQLVFQIEKILINKGYKSIGLMNMASVSCALAAEIGLKPREYYYYSLQIFMAAIIPCYVDAFEKPEGSFLPVSCSKLQYEGTTSKRKWN